MLDNIAGCLGLFASPTYSSSLLAIFSLCQKVKGKQNLESD